jgi:hypothetical protein
MDTELHVNPYQKKMHDGQPYWLIPSAINLEEILKNNPPAFKYKIDHFYYIIDTICNKMEYFDPGDKSKWVILNAQVLQGFNHDYRRYLDYLEHARILIINRQYHVGAESRGYIIRNEFYNGEVDVVLIKDFIIRRKVIQQRFKYQSTRKSKSVVSHQHLSKWFNCNLQIDHKAATEEVERLFPTCGQIGGVKGRKIRRGTDGKFKALRAIKRINLQDFYHHTDNNIGRYHSNLTNMKKEIRNYITYDGKQLVNLDIKNAQPLFSGVLLKKSFYQDEGKFTFNSIKSLNKLFNYNHTHINKIKFQILDTITLVESLQTSENQEFNNYTDIVEAGLFYEEIKKIVFAGRDKTRKQLKEVSFILFFADNKHGGEERRNDKKFSGVYPNVFKIFYLLKRHNKAILSHILQRIETTIIIDRITHRIASERPLLPIFTIHDSIATIVGNEEYVEKVMVEEIKKLIGLKATIGREYWK